MARVLKVSHSFTCTPCVHPQQNEPYLPLPSQPKLELIYWPWRDGRLSWPRVPGWLHTEISVRLWELNPYTVAHLSTNWAWHRLTSFVKANTLTMCQTANHFLVTYWKENEGQSISWKKKATHAEWHWILSKVSGNGKSSRRWEGWRAANRRGMT